MRSKSLLVVSLLIPTIAYFVTKTNWPYALFISLLHIATLKETYFPSSSYYDNDSTTSPSPQIRGLSWLLLSGPPPPHDVQQIRSMVDTLWPNIWKAIGMPVDTDVKEVKISTTSGAGGAVVYEASTASREDMDDADITARIGLLFQPTGVSEDTDAAVIFVHGGGLIAGTVQTEYGVSAELSKRCHCPVLSVDYRILPENTIEEAVSDVVAAFDWLTMRYGKGKRISIVGGSAGGILTLLSGISLRDRLRRWIKIHAEGDNTRTSSASTPPIPASLGILSPGPGLEWLRNPPDVHWPSLSTNHERDGFMAGGFYHYVRHLVFDDAFTRQYFALALSDLTGLPPCLVTVGGHEVLLSGARSLADGLGKAGIAVTFREYNAMPHVHHALYFRAKESSDALDNVVAWVLRGNILS